MQLIHDLICIGDETACAGFDEDSHHPNNLQTEGVCGGTPQSLVHQHEIRFCLSGKNDGFSLTCTKIMAQQIDQG